MHDIAEGTVTDSHKRAREAYRPKCLPLDLLSRCLGSAPVGVNLNLNGAAGQYGSGAAACAGCALGQYASSAGSSTCTACAKGQFASSTGSSACTLCSGLLRSHFVVTRHGNSSWHMRAVVCCDVAAVGQYADTTGASSCSNCAAGYSSAAGSTSSAACTGCGSGQYSLAGGACSPCAGT